MKNRCLNKMSNRFQRYGARGITICERWMEFHNFLEDMGHPPKGMQLDRIDNDKGYFPENCKWSSRSEQAKNRSTTVVIRFKGESKCLTDWATHLGIDRHTIRERLNKKFPIEMALSTKRINGLVGSCKDPIR